MIEENASCVLAFLDQVQRDEIGMAWVSGQQLQEATGLSPAEINDAVMVLQESGLVEWMQFLGTAPFVFGQVMITPRGRYELQRIRTSEEAKRERREAGEAVKPMFQLPPTPVGSPYGFTDEDWEIVAEAKARSDELNVVLGFQFESDKYNTEELKSNIEKMFHKAIEEYNQKPNTPKITMNFKTLAAGYGEHLFNEIARDIISADIAVFETSALNPNVMLEMGVALTWGVRVLPIKAEGCPKPPSDISGHTWADYRDSAREFLDQDHHRKLVRMVERAARKKGRS